MSLVKVTPQDMASGFCQQPLNVENLLFIENISAFAYYSEKNGYYKIYTDEEFERMIYLYLTNNYKQAITKSLVKDIVTQISWIISNRIHDIITTDYIALSDKLLNMKTFDFEPFSVSKPVFHKINCDSSRIKWDSNSRFASFLDEIFQDETGSVDREMIAFLQEIFGYCLLPSLEAHASFFFVGEGNNGKSVTISLIRSMIGENNTVSESIESLTANRFSMSSLVGKKLNLCSEEESTYIKSDRFKALVSGDNPMTIEFKFGKRIPWIPTCKHVFCTNEFPTFSGFNEGLLRRIKILPFKHVIAKDKRDTKLTATLLSEMGVIIAWAIEGAKRLIANKFFFTEPEASIKSSIEFTKNLSAAVLFLQERYVEDAKNKIFLSDLYDDYIAWSEKRGKKKQSYYSFVKDINKVLKLKGGEEVKELGQPIEEYRFLKVRGSLTQIEF